MTTSLAAVCAFGVAACGDDDSGTTEDDTTAPEPDVEEDVMDDTTPEGDTTEPTDPCDPNPCTNAPAAACNAAGDAVVTFEATGTCTDDSGSAACAYGTASETACDAGETCTNGACVAAGDACDYVFDGAVSYVSHLAIGSQDASTDPPSDTCCFDFGGADSGIDNSLGDLLRIAAAFVGDLNASITEQLEDGTLTLLLETVGVDDAVNDSDLTINGFYGEDSDTDFADNLGGMETFKVNKSSFIAGTASPLITFPGATITDGVLEAGPTLFSLSIPILEGVTLQADINDTRVEGNVAVGPNGSGLTMDGTATSPVTGETLGAKLGGVIKETDLYAALNGFMASSDCVDLGGDEFISPDGMCSSNIDTSACPDGDTTATLAGFCSTLLAFITPDIDTDNDGEEDAISIGVWLKATSATIDGFIDGDCP